MANISTSLWRGRDSTNLATWSVDQTNAAVANHCRCLRLSRPHSGQLDATVSVRHAQDDGLTRLRVVQGFNNLEKDKIMRGYSQRLERICSWLSAHWENWVYLPCMVVYVECLQVYGHVNESYLWSAVDECICQWWQFPCYPGRNGDHAQLVFTRNWRWRRPLRLFQ